ncbi:MAG: Tail-specific protease precursor [Spirochaetes bacterium ADurb.Bin218]|jgi:carboxyl-terminal processing protease|nr:carboxy terminal-processing peptidase [Spirochaetota bacterium]OQA99450.1 MAG: Tail-specific protease precursor [Spirochaetes bacterium ADurb.Bin218]HOQ11304.1 carboxy terminal-processing peptidase [Spirochaetota bacterium]HOV07625.1 carboxy terminal-processing peptidase [Spirochaetota bacterium]HPX90674.1 carboxy terminal-processing peptidase [Spirochaetota bacterium]
MFKKSFVSILTVFIVFSCFKKSEGLKHSDVQYLIGQVLSVHAQYNELDDELSKRILSNYIDTLDYGKYYFYQSDISEFSKHEKHFDDYITIGDFRAVYEIFNVYKKRYDEAMEIFDELLKADYDFQVDETIITDRRNVPFAANKDDMRERWRKNIKLQLLNYISAGKDINEAKQKLQKKYQLAKKRLEEINNDKLMDIFLNSVTTALDPHTNYLSYEDSQDFDISMKLKLEGIGVRLRSEDGFVIVESIITGGAADKLPEELKLKPNDKIMAVAQGNGDPVDVIDMDLKDVVKLIRGEKGTKVTLTILRESVNGDKPQRLKVPIVREEIKLEDSEVKYSVHSMDRDGHDFKIGYIKLPSFYKDDDSGKSSSGDTKAAIENLKKEHVNLIVLDLRGNPGGRLDEAVEIAGLFIDEGPVLQVMNKNNPPRIYYDNDPAIYYSGPLVVLIDRFSASASEILAGALKDYRRALIIGASNTFGKGTVQSYSELRRNMGAIKITTHIFYQPGGTSNQLNGIAPDILVPDMSSIWDISEAESKYPLKWQRIDPANFKKYNMLNESLVKSLKSISEKRTSAGEYAELRKKIKEFSAKIKKKEISLREEADLSRKRDKEIEESIRQEHDKKIVDLKKDLFLREAFNLGIDYIERIPR